MSILLSSTYTKGDNFYKSMRVILWYDPQDCNPFITHEQDLDGNKYHGHYFPDYISAEFDFNERIRLMGVQLFTENIEKIKNLMREIR